MALTIGVYDRWRYRFQVAVYDSAVHFDSGDVATCVRLPSTLSSCYIFDLNSLTLFPVRVGKSARVLLLDKVANLLQVTRVNNPAERVIDFAFLDIKQRVPEFGRPLTDVR